MGFVFFFFLIILFNTLGLILLPKTRLTFYEITSKPQIVKKNKMENRWTEALSPDVPVALPSLPSIITLTGLSKSLGFLGSEFSHP